MAKSEVIVIGGTPEEHTAVLRAVVERERQQRAQAAGPDDCPAGDRCGDCGSPMPSSGALRRCTTLTRAPKLIRGRG